MPRDFIPSTDQGLLEWATPFSDKITATPTDYGLTAGNATALATLLSTYSTALAAATDPSTRGGSTVNAKKIAKVNLVAYCRTLARAIQGTITVTDQQRYDLGLTVRDVEPSPIPPPANAPQVLVEAISGNTVTIRMIDPENPTRRGRPDGVDGMAVFSFVGAEAPQVEAEWTFEGNTTRTTANVVFGPTVSAGSKVWFTAFYFNPRAQSGPAATPVSTQIAGGSAMAA